MKVNVNLLCWSTLASLCLLLLALPGTLGDSPRKESLYFLSGIGCTNLLVANMVIDAVTFNIPATTVQARLSNIPNVLATDIAKISDPYMKQYAAYVAAKAKAKGK